MPPKKLKKLDDFREGKLTRSGYIVIVDMTGSQIRTAKCANVDITHFREEVMANKGKDGEYYFVDDLSGGMIGFKAQSA